MKRDWYKIILTILIFLFAFFVWPTPISVQAKTYISEGYGFSIEIPDGWIKKQPSEIITIVKFVNEPTKENVSINVLPCDEKINIEEIDIRFLIKELFPYITIQQQKYETINSIRYLQYTYVMIEELKKQLNLNVDLQFLAYSCIHKDRVFTITFCDIIHQFASNARVFGNIIESFRLQ